MIIENIIRKTKKRDRYNCLTFSVHERYQGELSDTNTDFYMLNYKDMKPWNTKFGPIPKNHEFLAYEENLTYDQVPSDLRIDFILSQNKFGNYQIAKEMQRYLHVPIVQLEHTLPPKDMFYETRLDNCKKMRGDINIFISKFSMNEWGFQDDEVIHHSVNTNIFENRNEERSGNVVSVVNDFINRDYFCGYQVWEKAVNGLPYEIYGDTQGLSSPTESVNHLVTILNNSKVFLNTSLVSPIPMSLLEAMSCGCAPVSTETCMIPDIITHGENGFMSNDPDELNKYCQMLLDDEELRIKIGNNAAKTIREMFSKDRFTQEWNNVFERAADLPYLG